MSKKAETIAFRVLKNQHATNRSKAEWIDAAKSHLRGDVYKTAVGKKTQREVLDILNNIERKINN